VDRDPVATRLLLLWAEAECYRYGQRVARMRDAWEVGLADEATARRGAEVLVGRAANRVDDARLAVSVWPRRSWWGRVVNYFRKPFD
jgi:hypothetical protein